MAPAAVAEKNGLNGAAVTDAHGFTSHYTASDAFFEALWQAGITHCFVNLGSDHPAIIEAMVKGQNGGKFPRIITCPNEMVAMSMADGYARLTNEPQAVIVHVDVGTQALAAAVHNASAGRAPVLLFAGLSPFTQEGEMRGSRTEFIHWLQDIPDQRQIVAQYCRYTAELKTGKNIKQMVNRALSFANSDPKGPVYLCGAREVMEEEISPYDIQQEYWNPVEPTALSPTAIETIANALINAKEPLLLTGYSGRNPDIPAQLVQLANTVKGLRVLDTGGCDLCFPANHPGWLGFKYGVDDNIRTADVILVLDCDVPWIPTLCKPKADAKVFHIDVDPLKQQMPLFYINAERRYRADSYISIKQINDFISSTSAYNDVLSSSLYNERWEKLQQSYEQKLASIESLAKPADDGTFGTAYLCNLLRKTCPEESVWVIEAVTNTGIIYDQLQAHLPKSWINCGAGGLGWSGGAALGVKLATDYTGKPKFVCQIVGDGTYLFSVPGSVYWISKRYKIPILTIVLNNKGWNAPRKSLLLVHPEGHGSKVSNEEINISFAPTPDYPGIAKAAAGGDLWTGYATTAKELDTLLPEAVKAVLGGQTAVLDAQIDGSEGKYQADKRATEAGESETVHRGGKRARNE